MSDPDVNTARCKACSAVTQVAVVCAGCFKPICVECVLDDERERGRCWMCIDWPAGRRASHGKGHRQHAA
jgi:hypothetical protein